MNAREEVLARVRSALATPGTHHPRTDGPPRTTRGIPVPEERSAVLELFAERVADYRAVVERFPARDLAAAIAAALDQHGAGSAVVPEGFEQDWLAEVGDATRLIPQEDATSSQVLDGIAAVVSTSTVGIATTGTIVLDHSAGQGPRALTLVPDLHICVVRADQVVPDVPEAVTRLRASIDAGRALTWVSGPSATSDIELDRVEGVHGPRTLHVILVDD